MTVHNDVCRGEGAGEADDEPHDDGAWMAFAAGGWGGEGEEVSGGDEEGAGGAVRRLLQQAQHHDHPAAGHLSSSCLSFAVPFSVCVCIALI